MPSYWVATHSDLFRYFPSAACTPDAKPIEAVYVASSLFCSPGHGFDGGEPVRFAARPGLAIPSVLSSTVWYTVAPLRSFDEQDFFTVLDPATNLPIVLTDPGSGPFSVKENFLPKIDRIMAERTSYLEANAIAYRGPWVTPPGWAPMIVAQLAAPDVAQTLRIATARYDVAAINARALEAEKFVDMLRNGAPMTDGIGPIDATPLVADDAARMENAFPVGWREWIRRRSL